MRFASEPESTNTGSCRERESRHSESWDVRDYKQYVSVSTVPTGEPNLLIAKRRGDVLIVHSRNICLPGVDVDTPQPNPYRPLSYGTQRQSLWLLLTLTRVNQSP